MGSLANFHFIRPLFFMLIPILLALVYLHYLYKQRASSWQRYCDPQLFNFLRIRQSPINKTFYQCVIAFFVIACIALAGPTWERKPEPVYQSLSAHVFVLDLSLDMLAEDLLPSRLERAKYKIVDAIHKIKEGGIGLVAFADEGYVVSPITSDKKTIIHLLNVLHPRIMPEMGNNMASGLTKALELVKNQHSKQAQIVLLTANEPPSDSYTIASEIKNNRYNLSILGIGTTDGTPIPLGDDYLKLKDGNLYLSKLPSDALTDLAQSANGLYRTISGNDSDLQTLIEELSSKEAVETTDQKQSDRWQDNGYWLIWLLLPLVIRQFRRGAL